MHIVAFSSDYLWHAFPDFLSESHKDFQLSYDWIKQQTTSQYNIYKHGTQTC